MIKLLKKLFSNFQFGLATPLDLVPGILVINNYAYSYAYLPANLISLIQASKLGRIVRFFKDGKQYEVTTQLTIGEILDAIDYKKGNKENLLILMQDMGCYSSTFSKS